MKSKNNIFIAGHNGMVGKAVSNYFINKSYGNIFVADRSELDLMNLIDFERFITENSINEIIFCAAKVGGINANRNKKFDFLYQNSVMQNNLFYIVEKHKIEKLTFLGSSCIYPRDCKQPIKEDYLLQGYLEETNDAYALAKICGVKYCEILNSNNIYDCRALMPTNIYGYNDNFSLEDSHVVPALIRKFYEANKNNDNVTLWGTGSPYREIMFSEDLASAIFHIHTMQKEDYFKITGPSSLMNVGSGDEMQIKEIAHKIAGVINFQGEISFDSNYPDGTPRKRLDLSRLDKTGWMKKYSVDDGLESTIKWYENNINNYRD